MVIIIQFLIFTRTIRVGNTIIVFQQRTKIFLRHQQFPACPCLNRCPTYRNLNDTDRNIQFFMYILGKIIGYSCKICRCFRRARLPRCSGYFLFRIKFPRYLIITYLRIISQRNFCLRIFHPA